MPTTIQLSHKTYAFDLRKGYLFNVHNPRDTIPFQALTEHLLRLVSQGNLHTKQECMEAALTFDRVLQRPEGTTTSPLLARINENKVEATPAHKRLTRKHQLRPRPDREPSP